MFDFARESPSFIQAAYCFIFYVLFFILTYKDYYTCKYISSSIKLKLRNQIIILFFIFTLTYFADTDFFHYYELVKQLSRGHKILTVEAVYRQIAYLVNYQYILFRVVIWGGACLIIYKTAKLAQIRPDLVFYTLFIFFFGLFAYARSSLAMAILFIGFLYWNNNKPKSSYHWIGLLIMIVSIAFHTSMVLALLCCLIAPVIKLTKKRVFLYLLAIPLFSFIIREGLIYIINMDGMIYVVLASW